LLSFRLLLQAAIANAATAASKRILGFFICSCLLVKMF
jgi:hypothetical protein